MHIRVTGSKRVKKNLFNDELQSYEDFGRLWNNSRPTPGSLLTKRHVSDSYLFNQKYYVYLFSE